MKIIIVADVIGRKTLHRYGHPIKHIVNSNPDGNRIKLILNGKNSKGLDSTVYKAIYSINKYRILYSTDPDILFACVMVVDDDYNEVYKFCPINGFNITISSFDNRYKDIGLKLKTNINKKDDKKAVIMLLEHPKLKILDNIFEFYGVVSDCLYEQFIENHYDLLLEQYLDPIKITAKASFIWTSIDKGLIFNYISRKWNCMSNKAIQNVSELLYHAIFKEKIRIFSARFGLSNSNKLITEEHINELISPVIKFIRSLDRHSVRNSRLYEIEEFFISLYYLLGKPDLDDPISQNNIKKIKPLELSLIPDETFELATYTIPYHNYLTLIYERTTDEELYELFQFKNFNPFKSFHIDSISEKRWLSKDEETLETYNILINRNKNLKKIIDKRYIIPKARNSIYILNSLHSIDISLFFLYMQGNFTDFMHDIEIVDYIIESNSMIRIFQYLDCDKFVNEKIKNEFIRILLLRMEYKYSMQELKRYMKFAKTGRKDKKLDSTLIQVIKDSNYPKLKGALKCNKL